MTFANIPEHCDDANRECDFLSLNEYAGWYYDVAQRKSRRFVCRARGEAREAARRRLRKPIMISECGADTLPGCHMMGGPGLWSEEFQSALLRTYTSLVRRHRPVWGACLEPVRLPHAADAPPRAGGVNHKGVFTRLREPKMAAHMLRADWAARTRAAARDHEAAGHARRRRRRMRMRGREGEQPRLEAPALMIAAVAHGWAHVVTR